MPPRGARGLPRYRQLIAQLTPTRWLKDPVTETSRARRQLCTRSSSPSQAVPRFSSGPRCPTRVPGPGEVLIDVAASAVNRADMMQRQGFYPPPPGAPPYPGLECSGTIAALGDGVTGWRLGDQVCALLAGGGYAEKVAVPAGQLLPRSAEHHAGRGGRAAGDGLHRVLQRLPGRPPRRAARRCSSTAAAAASARRRSSSPSTPAPSSRSPPGSREKLDACRAARRGHHDQLPRGRLRGKADGGHRRPRRGRDPRHHRRRLPGQEHRRARAGRPDRQHRAAAGPPGRARPQRADGQARHDHVDHAAGAPRGAEGEHRRGGGRATSGRSSTRA